MSSSESSSSSDASEDVLSSAADQISGWLWALVADWLKWLGSEVKLGVDAAGALAEEGPDDARPWLRI